MTVEAPRLDTKLWRRGRNILLFVAVPAWIACAYGWITDAYDFRGSYLVNYLFFLTIGWGAMFFVMMQHLTSAAWSVTIRRQMENFMITIPVLAVLFLPVALGISTLYEWSAAGFFDSHDPNLRFKAIFFSRPFYLARSAVYFSIWVTLSVILYRRSLALNDSDPTRAADKARWWSGPGMLVLTVTVTMASVDWVMSLDPFWYSTIFGIYVFSGGALAFVAALILVCLGLRRAGMLTESITVEHYHDLGKWLFALTIWWAYIAFSQYLLIWYADIPEETVFFKHRLEGYWGYLSAALLFGRFLIPFLVLLPRAAKRNLPVLGLMSALVLVMHGMDLHWLIMPSVHPHGFHLHWMDVATFFGIASLFGLAFWRHLRRYPMIPAGDLRLQQALSHQNS